MTSFFFVGMILFVGVCYSSPTNFIETTFEATISTPTTEEYTTTIPTFVPELHQCTNNAQCGPNHCCLLTPARYTVPSCMPMRGLDEICRPGEPIMLNTTLWFPDGKQIDVFNVHHAVCPCSNGLSCDKGICYERSN